MEYIWFFLAGALAANGVPYFVKGVTGQALQTPFGKASSATVNVVWGVANLAVAWLVWQYASNNAAHVYRYHLAFGLGLLAMGWVLANSFARRS